MKVSRNVALSGLIAKLAVFTAVSLVLTAVVVASLLDLDTSPQHTYEAIFTDASAIQNGDAVRMAGVKVGRVKSVRVHHHTEALVTFTVDTSQSVTDTTHAQIEYENLFGQRDLALTRGSGGTPVKSGTTIPLARTRPALDLTDLFNGFQPLFQALTPTQINQLSANIIGAFQGQSGNFSALVTQAAQLTNNLADRQQVIDQVVNNLDRLLTTVGAHDAQVGQFIDGFARLSTTLAGDRGTLSSALDSASTLTGSLSGIIGQIQPSFEASVARLTGVTQALAANQSALDATLTQFPHSLNVFSSVFQNGTFANTYLCQLYIHVYKPLILTPFPVPPALTTLLAPISNLLPSNLSGLTSGGTTVSNGFTGNPALHTPNCQP
ncbi:MCE family protein [Acidiferrimicrobium sp. IK]|uniref:MCE family protein n=1 Tax=Acidiferrimicrobium sp. IK TaxID=2871700 RepID=UPI0021CB8923|nr:MCE family protein [Acidiferrimicrobium sp. IK]MCU4186678.1 MCE family protein [Acidiferrimicrobium sp. IK]